MSAINKLLLLSIITTTTTTTTTTIIIIIIIVFRFMLSEMAEINTKMCQ